MKPSKEPVADWERQLDEKWYLHDYALGKPHTYTTCGEDVKMFFRSVLAVEIAKAVRTAKLEVVKEAITLSLGIRDAVDADEFRDNLSSLKKELEGTEALKSNNT